ncbi:MAG TPA: hypothetical protein VG982_00760 [Candidatus Paceibacterota bacterium]|nr:hypothetical protein [Candidatus Paceibacterota bacterium]
METTENKNGSMNHGSGKCGCGCLMCSAGHHRVFRLVAGIVILILAFVLGMKFGEMSGWEHGGFGGRDDRMMMRGNTFYQYSPYGSYGPKMMQDIPATGPSTSTTTPAPASTTPSTPVKQ